MGNGKKEGHMHLDVDGNALNIVPQLNFNEAFPFYSTGDATVQTLSSSASPSFHDFTAPSSLFPLVCSVKADHMWGPLKKNSSMIDQTNVGWDFFCIVNVRSSTGNGRFSAYFSVTEKMWNTNEGKNIHIHLRHDFQIHSCYLLFPVARFHDIVSVYSVSPYTNT